MMMSSAPEDLEASAGWKQLHTMPTWGAGALAGLINQEELSKIYLRNHGAHINADANADAKVTKNRLLLTFLNMILYC